MGLLEDAAKEAEVVAKKTAEANANTQQATSERAELVAEIQQLAEEFVAAAKQANLRPEKLRQIGQLTRRAYGPRILGWELYVSWKSETGGLRGPGMTILATTGDWYQQCPAQTLDKWGLKADGQPGVTILEENYPVARADVVALRQAMVIRLADSR
jgi:uncharacterized phage infection (PIP) family protein YhgE